MGFMSMYLYCIYIADFLGGLIKTSNATSSCMQTFSWGPRKRFEDLSSREENMLVFFLKYLSSFLF